MTTEKLWCKAGSHFWDREIKRGRKPVVCPDHVEVGPALAPSQPEDLEARLVKARQVKAERAAERQQEQVEGQREELARLEDAIPKLSADWNKWMDRAGSATNLDKINEAFDKADQLQSQIIGSQRRIATLKAKVAA